MSAMASQTPASNSIVCSTSCSVLKQRKPNLCITAASFLHSRVTVGFLSQRASNTETWWRHQMGTFSALLAICAGNSPSPRWIPRTKASDAELWCFFSDLRLNKRLSKQPWGWWFGTLSRPLWRHCNEACPCHCHILHLNDVKFVKVYV